MTRALLHPRPNRQLRGPAWIDGEFVVLDATRATHYDPLTESNLGMALARLKTPTEVVDFVQRFGLLSAKFAGLKPATLPSRVVEPIADILKEAARLLHLVKTASLVRRGAAGDAAAIKTLRERFKGIDDRAVLLAASAWVTWWLTRGLSEASPIVYDPAIAGGVATPGQFRIGIKPESLLEVCYLMISHTLAGKEPIEVCPECDQPFLPDDPRQRFCTPTHASRARARRFKKGK